MWNILLIALSLSLQVGGPRKIAVEKVYIADGMEEGEERLMMEKHYDREGHIVRLLDYNEEGELMREVTSKYNEQGDIVLRTVKSDGNVLVTKWGYTYNPQGRPSGGWVEEAGQKDMLKFKYHDDGGHTLTRVYEGETVEEMVWNAQGLVQSICAAGNCTYSHYDEQGQLILQEDQGEYGSFELSWENTYGDEGQLEASSGEEGVTTYLYSPDGRKIGERFESHDGEYQVVMRYEYQYFE